MTTDDLIPALTADGYVGRKLRLVLLMALPPTTALVAILFFTRIGFRDDIDDALRTARFLFKFVVIVPLVEATVPWHGSRPSIGWWAKLLPLPVLLLCVG